MSVSLLTLELENAFQANNKPDGSLNKNPHFSSLESMVKTIGGARYQQFSDGKMGYDWELTANTCQRILRTYLEKVEEVHGKFPDDAYGVITCSELRDNGSIFINGDMHGAVGDFISRLEFLKLGEYIDSQFRCPVDMTRAYKVVFLGDYFGRSRDSLKLFMMLLLFKLENWHQVELLRGNHETRKMVSKEVYGPEKELLRDKVTLKLLDRVFSTFTIKAYFGCKEAPISSKKYILCSHAGILPEHNLDDVIRDKGFIIVRRNVEPLFPKEAEKYLKMNLPQIKDEIFKKRELISSSDDEKNYQELLGKYERIVAAQAQQIFYSVYMPKIFEDRKAGFFHDLWMDVEWVKGIRNSPRGRTYMVPLDWVAHFLQSFSTEASVGAMFLGHCHERKTFSIELTDFSPSIPMMMMPVSGEHDPIGTDRMVHVVVNSEFKGNAMWFINGTRTGNRRARYYSYQPYKFFKS